MSFQEILIDIDENNYHDFIEGNLTILHFFSDWQMNCLMVLPVLEQLAEEFQGKIKFGKVNVDEAEDLAEMHSISRVPCLVVFKDKEEVARIECDSEDLIREKISELLQVC